jgi:hypothetical protein
MVGLGGLDFSDILPEADRTFPVTGLWEAEGSSSGELVLYDMPYDVKVSIGWSHTRGGRESEATEGSQAYHLREANPDALTISYLKVRPGGSSPSPYPHSPPRFGMPKRVQYD